MLFTNKFYSLFTLHRRFVILLSPTQITPPSSNFLWLFWLEVDPNGQLYSNERGPSTIKWEIPSFCWNCLGLSLSTIWTHFAQPSQQYAWKYQATNDKFLFWSCNTQFIVQDIHSNLHRVVVGNHSWKILFVLLRSVWSVDSCQHASTALLHNSEGWDHAGRHKVFFSKNRPLGCCIQTYWDIRFMLFSHRHN